MEFIKCTKNGTEGVKGYEEGTCYIGTDAKQRAYSEYRKHLSEQQSQE